MERNQGRSEILEGGEIQGGGANIVKRVTVPFHNILLWWTGRMLELARREEVGYTVYYRFIADPIKRGFCF